MTTTTKGTGTQGVTTQNPEPKPEKSNTTISPSGKSVSVEEKILKVSQLQERINMRRTLLGHLEKVEALKFGEFADKDILSINDGKGAAYQIKNSNLMKKVQGLLRDELKGELVKVESEIQF